MSNFVPYHVYSKIGQIWVLLKYLVHNERQSVIAIATLCNYTKDTVV